MNFSFAEKNSSCVMIVSADNEDEALDELKDKVKKKNKKLCLLISLKKMLSKLNLKNLL